jgi:hypothetical protein
MRLVLLADESSSTDSCATVARTSSRRCRSTSIGAALASRPAAVNATTNSAPAHAMLPSRNRYATHMAASRPKPMMIQIGGAGTYSDA